MAAALTLPTGLTVAAALAESDWAAVLDSVATIVYVPTVAVTSGVTLAIGDAETDPGMEAVTEGVVAPVRDTSGVTVGATVAVADVLAEILILPDSVAVAFGLALTEVDIVANCVEVRVATGLKDCDGLPVPEEESRGLRVGDRVPLGDPLPVALALDDLVAGGLAVVLPERDGSPEEDGDPLVERVGRTDMDGDAVSDADPELVASDVALLAAEEDMTGLPVLTSVTDAEYEALTEPLAEDVADVLDVAQDVLEAVGQTETVTVRVCVHVKKRVDVDVREARPEVVGEPEGVREIRALTLIVPEVVLVLDTDLEPVDVTEITGVRVAGREPEPVAEPVGVLLPFEDALKVLDAEGDFEELTERVCVGLADPDLVLVTEFVAKGLAVFFPVPVEEPLLDLDL